MEDTHRTVGHADLGPSVRRLAATLVQRGVSPGDRLAVVLPNCAAAVELYLACALVGAIWVGINPAAPAAERDRQCALVGPVLTIADNMLSALETEQTETFDGAPPQLSTPCAIGFSSGTTGTPKAIVHTRAGVSLVAAVLAQSQLRAGDRVGVILPMSIHNLIAVGALPSLFAGATCVPVRRMDAAGVAAACHDLGLSRVNALVPATIYDLVHDDTIPPEALASLRTAGTGAAGLSEALREAFEAKFGCRLVASYGMTEAPGVVCIEDPDVPHTAGASGTPLPHLTVTACDVRGKPLLTGQEGEIIVGPADSGPWADLYSPAVGRWTADGLLRRPATEKTFRTGDYGWIDADGAVHVTGRSADVIVRGGVNVNAAELESVLAQLPAVRDVAVVGAEDTRLGQRIVAFIEPSNTAVDAESLRRCAREVLSHGKVPDEFVVTELPRNAMGKVARAQLLRR